MKKAKKFFMSMEKESNSYMIFFYTTFFFAGWCVIKNIEPYKKLNETNVLAARNIKVCNYCAIK